LAALPRSNFTHSDATPVDFHIFEGVESVTFEPGKSADASLDAVTVAASNVSKL